MRYTARIVSASILLAALIAAACFATAAGSGRQELDQARAEAELGGLGVQTAMRIMLWTEPRESGAVLLPRPTAEEKEHLARAEAGARAALSLEPDLVPALVLLGRLAWIGGRATEANNSYQRALLIAPDAGQALLGMADLQLDQRKPEKALSYLRGIRSTERGLADAVALRSGVISLMRGDARDALAAVAGAEPRTEAEELPYLWLIAKSCAISGESAVAEAVLARETPAWARPLWAEAHGLSMLAMGADGKALAELNRAAVASPAYALPRWERALILLNRNDAAGALKALAGEKPAAGALAGGSLFLLGTAREEAKDAAGAIRVYNELAGKRPRLGLAYYGLGRACYLAKRYSEALRHLTRGIKIAPDLPCLYLQRAEVYDKLKMRSQAKKDRKAAEAAAVPAESRGWRMEARSAAGDGASPAALVSISGNQTPHGLFVSVDGRKWRWHPWHGMPVPVPGAAIGGIVYAVPDDGVTGPLLANTVAPPASIDAQAPVFVRPAALSLEAEDPVLVWRTDEPTRAELSLWPAGGNARNSIMLRDDSFSPWHRLDLSDLMPGEYTLVLTIYDAAGNSASSGQFNARIRHAGYTLEGGFTIESGAAWVNHRVVTLSFTLEGSQQGAMVRVANEGGLFTRWRALTPVLTWELSQGDGEKTVSVQFRRGAAMSPVYSGRVILDTRPPAIYGLLQPTVTDTGAVLTWRTDEETDARIDLQQGTGWAAVFVSPGFAEEHRAQLSGLAPGTRYILRITATDRAGNSSRLDRVELVTVAAPDRTPPEGWFQINGGARFTNSVFVTLSIDGRDAESGVRSMSFSNDGLLWSLPEPFARSKQWRLNPGDGPKLVYMRLVDGAGNISTPITAQITLDTTPPSIRDLAARLRADGRLEFSFRTNEPSYGLIQTGRNASFPQPTLDELRAGGLAREHSAIVTPPAGGGVFYYRAAACDQVGNTAVSAVESLVTREPDRNGPTGGIRIEDGALFVRKTRVRLSLWADDPSGVAGMRLRNAGSSWGPWEKFAATRAWDLAPGDGEKEVQVRYRDNLGNESPVFQARIILDTSPPRISDVVVNEVGKGAVEIAWRTDEPTFGVVRYGQAMRSYSEREDENRSLLPQEAGGGFSREHRVRLARLQPGRLYYAVIEAIDRAGNGASSPEFTFTAGGGDTNPPRGRIEINRGAEFTNSPQVTLELSATDAEGAVTGMAFSADGRDWSREEPYRATRNYTLPGGDGRKTVYVRYRDAAGNWSEAASDSIVLDTSPPNIGDIAIRTLDRDSVELAWRTSEPAWCEVRYGREKKRYSENAREKGSRADGQYGTEHRVVLERLKPNQTYYFIVTAYDRAGNESTTPEGHFDLKGQGGGDDAGGGAGTNVALTGNGGKAFGTGKRAEAAVDGNYQTYWEYKESPGPGKSNSAPIFWMVTFARRTRLSSLKLIMSWGGCPFTIEYKQGNRWIKAFEVNGDNIASFQKGERGGAPCLEFNLGVQAEAVRLNWATRSKNVSIRLYEAEALAAG